MYRFLLGPLALFATQSALAQDGSRDDGSGPLTVSGSAALLSDYRFRGVSQTDNNIAVQAGVTITHRSGFYVGSWGSNLAGWGSFGGPNMELDLIAGRKLPVAGGTLDTGLVWYLYPGGADRSDFGELFARLSGSTGPLSLTAGIAYAPAQRALGNVYPSGVAAQAGIPARPNDKKDNLYVSGDGSWAMPDMPISGRLHIGYSKGNPGLGPNGTSLAPTGSYWDWSVGTDIVPLQGMTLGIAYVDTDISPREAAYLQPGFSRGQDGSGHIAGSTLLMSLTTSF